MLKKNVDTRSRAVKRISDEEEFDTEIYDEEATALVFFHKKNCPACKGAEAILERLNTFTVDIFDIDVEDNSGIFRRFCLSGVPQVLGFKDGMFLEVLTGLHEPEAYSRLLFQLIGKQYAYDFIEQGDIFQPVPDKAGSDCSGGICKFRDYI